MTVTKETAAFQLCDIHDLMLKEIIEDEEDLREECNERDGWYSTHAFERIKTVLRHKFFSLLGGHVATREECEALLVPQEGTNKLPQRPAQRLRFGKHNMAKGAMPPEDAAVSARVHQMSIFIIELRDAGTQAHADAATESERRPQPGSSMTQVSPFNLRMMISARACVISVAMQSIFKCFGAFHFCVNSPKHTAVHMDDGSDNGLHDDTPHPRTGSSQRDVLDRQQTSASHEEVDHDSPALASARAFRCTD